MAYTTPIRSIRRLRTGLPAAVIGTLAGALAAVPAHAADGTHGAASAVPLPATGAVQTPTARPAAASDAPETYTVRSGDTVWAIARRHDLRPADVLAWNGIGSSAVIHPGQVLRLTPPASRPEPASDSAKTHTVVAGDTVWAIAKAGGTSVAAVLAANGLAGDSIIYPGQKLVIPSAGSAAPASLPTAPHTDLNAKQAENARMIIRIGRELGVPERGIAIALATSMVEAKLRNLDYGDRDSLGLFQQRPSTGWGTPADIRHRGNSIRAFYLGKGDATRGLLDIPGWQQMRFTDAAQAVQISAYPERYGQWEKQAYRWLELYG